MDWHGERRYAIYENFQLANEQVRNGESSDFLALVCEGGAAAQTASDRYQCCIYSSAKCTCSGFLGFVVCLTDKQPWDQGHNPGTFSFQLSAQISG